MCKIYININDALSKPLKKKKKLRGKRIKLGSHRY